MFAPDDVVDTGGIMNSYLELMTFIKTHSMQLIENIYEATCNVLKLYEPESISIIVTTNKIAGKRITDIEKLNQPIK